MIRSAHCTVGWPDGSQVASDLRTPDHNEPSYSCRDDCERVTKTVGEGLMQSTAPVPQNSVPPMPTCRKILNTGPCADMWREYNQALQIPDLDQLTADQQAQIKKLNDQIQAGATAALQAKSNYADAVVQAKMAARTEGLEQGAGVGVGVTLLVFALRLGFKRLIRNFTVATKPKARAASA
jgi:hypothetical protein